MTKGKLSFALIMTLVVIGLLMAMIPGSAVAAPGIVEVNWSESAYEGVDGFYGTTVVAYTAGSTVKMEFRVSNDTANDLTLTSAAATFDWGTCTPTAPAAFPVVLPAGGYVIFRFECAVPADATNQTLHNYKVVVQYQGMYGPTINSMVNWENVADLNLDYDVAVPGSVRLWDVTATGAQEITADKFSVAYLSGIISWVLPYPGPTGTPYASYEFIEDGIGLGGANVWMQGDGVTTVFRFQTNTANLPIIADSVKVVKAVIPPVSSVTKIDTGWTVDLNTGTLTFTTPPAAFEAVGVFYKNANSFIATGSNLAVVSADQASYTTAWRRYMETRDTYWLSITSAEGMQLRGEAEQLRAQAEIEYREGNFAAAVATMQSAETTLNAALTAEATFQGGVQEGLTGLLTGAGGVVDGYGAKLQAEANAITDQSAAEVSKIKAEATKAKGYGTFLVLLGVFFILVGVAALIVAVARFLGSRKAPQTS